MSRGRRVHAAVSVAEVHREPAHESEIVTQSLMGERLAVLERADGDRWLRVRLPDGYRGWIRSWLVCPDDPGWPGERLAEIDQPSTWIRSAPDPAADPVSDVVIGTRLPGSRAGAGWVTVRLPDGRAGFLPAGDLLRGRLHGAEALRRPAAAAARLATARRFLGVPYVWGGKSPRGFDCSGLVQLVHELHGIRIPRDSRDQRRFLARQGRPVRDPLAARAGSLCFFGPTPVRTTHVGFALGSGGLLHAQGRVRVDSLDPSNANYHKELAALFQVAYELLPPRGGLDSLRDPS